MVGNVEVNVSYLIVLLVVIVMIMMILEFDIYWVFGML